MKTYLLAFVLFFTFYYSNSNAQEFKLGKVSIAELEEKQKREEALQRLIDKQLQEDEDENEGDEN